MTEKLNIYDLLASVVPGALIVALVAIAVPDLASATKDLKVPDAFAVVVLVALALFAGNAIQAVASQLEPLLYKMWGGRPSERCLRHGLGDRYMPKDTAERIRMKLAGIVGASASDRSLFLYAMQLAESAGTQRVSNFNAMFAYLRALLILTLAATVTAIVIVCGYGPASWSVGLRWGVLVGCVGLLVLFFFRARQRSFYYVREVLLTAERVIDQKSSGGTAGSTSK